MNYPFVTLLPPQANNLFERHPFENTNPFLSADFRQFKYF